MLIIPTTSMTQCPAHVVTHCTALLSTTVGPLSAISAYAVYKSRFLSLSLSLLLVASLGPKFPRRNINFLII